MNNESQKSLTITTRKEKKVTLYYFNDEWNTEVKEKKSEN
jgi:hypothetical protein